MFSEAYDSGTIPMEFVNNMRKQGKLILGIGHRIKSVSYSLKRSCPVMLWVCFLSFTLVFLSIIFLFLSLIFLFLSLNLVLKC